MTTWWESDPGRHDRDRCTVLDWCPTLTWIDEEAGGWSGELPVWPFDRPRPAGLDALTSNRGLTMELRYYQSYPMMPPAIFPLDPEPDLILRTQHRWHLSGDGSLCLLRTSGQWTGRESVVDLLLKAAGWRIEYALMKSGALAAMSENGIVGDPVHDHLIADAGKEPECETSPSS